MIRICPGDCLEVLKTLPSESVDSLVTDPPAGISFMGKDWDSDKGGREEWITWLTEVMAECRRVLKPGAHALVWSIPRTSHWSATAVENAGFEIRDIVTHLFGQGFPKSLDVSKAIDKAAGAEREIIATVKKTPSAAKCHEGWERPWAEGKTTMDITAPATDAAKEWQGWGTALKPAAEFWILARKPLSEKTVAANVLKHGTGAINIDGCRIESVRPAQKYSAPDIRGDNLNRAQGRLRMEITQPENHGRFPANLVLSHSPHCTDDQCDIECAIRALDEQSLAGGMHSAGKARQGGAKQSNDGALFGIGNHTGNGTRIGDSGGASRFFYCSKISSSERNAGLEGMPDIEAGIGDERPSGQSMSRLDGRPPRVVKNHHPTVKPIKLMRYLCRLITPPNGTVLDPFMGSGSTGMAAVEEGFSFIGIEREPDYVQIAEKRIFHRFPKATKQAQG